MMTETRDEGEANGSDAAATPAVRYPTAIAVGGGLAAAVGSSFIPMNAIEGFVSAYGIAELLPAAAPPLGNTARLALSTGIGTLTAGALLALLPRGETDTMGFETAVKKDVASAGPGEEQGATATGFGATKLAGWLRTLRFGKTEPGEGEITDFGDLNRLRLRNGDQHPDAPVRAPILASSDLGAPLDTPPAPLAAGDPDDAVAPPSPILALDDAMAVPPSAPVEQTEARRFAPPPEFLHDITPDGVSVFEPAASLTDDAATEVAAPIAIAAEPEPEAYASAMRDATPGTEDLSRLDVPALLDRLESGLARRRAQAGEAFANPVVDAAPFARVVPLSIAPAPASDEQAPPSRFRLSEPAADFADEVAAPEAPTEGALQSESTGLWDDADEVQQPVASDPAASDLVSDPETAMDAPNAAVDAPAVAADDDMDAALRDALATLRQLSDRQRNV